MSLSDLASLGSFVSGFAVLVSLVYLALQTRALNRNQRAAIHWGRLQERTEWIRLVTQPDFIDVYLRGNAADQTLDDAQCTRYYHFVGSELREFEELFYQHLDGMIDDKRQASSLTRLRLRCSVPGFRVTWSVQREFYNEDFAKFVDDLICNASEAVNTNFGPPWRAAAAKEFAKASNST